MAEQIIQHLYRLKGGEQEAVERNNPKLERREPIVVYCKDGITRLKIGDGVHTFNELDWVGGNFTLDTDTPIENLDLEAIYSVLTKLNTDVNRLNSTIDTKVDKEAGKGLSTNDFTKQYKDKLDNIADGATNVTVVDVIEMGNLNAISSDAVAQFKTNINQTMSEAIEAKVSQEIKKEIEVLSLDGGQI